MACAFVSKYGTTNAHVTAIWRNTQNSSNWDPSITTLLGYKHTFCQTVVSTKKLLVFVYPYKRNILSAGLLRIGQAFVSPVELCVVGFRQIAVSSAINVNTSVLSLCGSDASTLLAAVLRGRVCKQLPEF
jgi:hypothetical protein